MYRPRVESVSRYVDIRGLRYHLRTWQVGAADGSAQSSSTAIPLADDAPAPMLLLLHGWMDVSASFQFVVDALQGHWRVVAPDWRGFGLTEGSPGQDHAVDSYAFADYLGDLDGLVEALSPNQPVRIAAHSMGGNVAMLYAGIRAAKVAGLVNLEGLGLPETDPAKAVERYRRWLDELQAPAAFRSYATLDDVAARLIRTNPRLPMDRARFLAEHWARPLPDEHLTSEPPGTQRVDASPQRRQPSGYVLRADPAHKRTNPVPYRVDEVLSCWRAIEAPVLWVASSAPDAFHRFTQTEQYRRRLTTIARLNEVEMADAGHMLHHDQPALVARLIEDFFK